MFAKDLKQQIANMSLQQISNSLVATSSGMIGGVTKAVTSGFTLCGVNLPQVIDVTIYAAISAFVGYVVKLGVDSIRRKINKKKENRQ